MGPLAWGWQIAIVGYTCREKENESGDRPASYIHLQDNTPNDLIISNWGFLFKGFSNSEQYFPWGQTFGECSPSALQKRVRKTRSLSLTMCPACPSIIKHKVKSLWGSICRPPEELPPVHSSVPRQWLNRACNTSSLPLWQTYINISVWCVPE